VSNVGFAHFVLHERVTRRVVFATFLIVGGCIILVLFGSRQSDELTVKDLMDLYARTTYVRTLLLATSLAS
jgi:drug/metabolite transporter (DMT)-like permease